MKKGKNGNIDHVTFYTVHASDISSLKIAGERTYVGNETRHKKKMRGKYFIFRSI